MQGSSWGSCGRRAVFGMVGLLLACGVIGGAAPAALASANVNWGTGVEGTLPSNANANPNVTINAVSCASVGNCVAVGSYVDNASPASTQGLLLSEVSGVWQPGVEAMVPSDTSVVPNATVQRVSCPSAGNCTAIGHYGANPG